MAVLRWEAGSTPRDPEHLHAYGRLLEELRHLEVTTATAPVNNPEEVSASKARRLN
jgi:hypothetical protein